MSSEKDQRKTIVGAINPDVLSFTVGNDPVLDLELTEWDCLGSAAHVTMLSTIAIEPTLFTPEERDAVLAELVAIIGIARRGEFVITEADQDVHLAVERHLTEKLGDLGKRVHTGRSRNDQVALDLRLHMRDSLLGVSREATTLASALLKLAGDHRDIPMVGRTHLQAAMPSSVGLWASGYAEALLDDLITVEAAYRYTNRSPLGSAAGYGVPLPIDRLQTARLLGFEAPIQNVFHASNTRGKCEMIILGALTQLMLTLSRLAEDLIIFTLPEFGYFSLPPEFCTGSSIMPQKYNPDVLELIRAKTARVMAGHTAIGTILKALPGGYNRDLQESKELYLEGMRTTRATLRIMSLMMAGLTVYPDKLRAGFAPGVFATDYALELVAGGMPFRDAYSHVRNNLDSLSDRDPDDALQAKQHLGTTGNLGLEQLQKRNNELVEQEALRSAALARDFGALLQCQYPELI